MFHECFGLSEDPFSITPDPKYTFLSDRHREALAHLVYGVTEGGGFVQLTGEVGTGKTTLCRNLLKLLPDELDIALIFNPRQTPLELVASLCDELHVSYPPECSSKTLVDHLNAYLLESHSAGRRTVAIIDEAQDLSIDALEQIRLLTNLETATRKLLQIILVGQTELQSLVAQPGLSQLGQRITARYHLTPLEAEETQAYVHHRLEVAGCQRRLFTGGAMRQMYRLTGGVPRLINVLCGRAMLAAYGRHQETINRRLLRQVAKELEGDIKRPVKVSWAWGLAGLLAITLGFSAWRALGPDGLPVLSVLTRTTASVRENDILQPPNLHLVATRSASAANPQVSPPAAESEAAALASAPVEPAPETPTPALSSAVQGPTPAVAPPSTEAAALKIGVPIPASGGPVPETHAPALLSTAPDPTPAAAPPVSSEVAALEVAAPAPVESTPAIPAPTAARVPVSQAIAHSLRMLDDIANAFTTLFSYWQSAYPFEAEGSACEKAARAGLQCLYGRGDWESLHFYNRPAVIELLLDSGRRYHVVVAALEGGQVTLDLGKQQVKAPQGELDPLWSGSYIVLWRPPALQSTALKQGSRGADVHWLSEMLGRIDGQSVGQPTDPEQVRFDWQLTKRVMAFQRRVGLKEDGVVGKKTLIKLKAAVNDPSIPALVRS